MAQRRRRHLRRNVLVFVGSLVAHVGLFFFVIKDFHFYPLHAEPEEAVQVQIVPQPEEIPPPVILPPIPRQQPTPQPPSLPPTPQPQPTPPKPQPPTPERATPQPVQTPTAPVAAPQKTAPAPAPKPAPAPSPLAPTTPAPAPGPPKAVSTSQLVKSQAQVSTQAPKILLHRPKEQGSEFAPSVSIPGAVFAPPTGPAPSAAGPAGGGGAPAGGLPGGTGLPGGALPGFGRGLRGGVLGCANAEALHLSAAEKARCAEAFGEGARESPQMSAIDSSKRQELDRESAAAAAAQKYRDSTPSGSEARPVAGQPRILQSPAQ
jgi:hypothetical protein